MEGDFMKPVISIVDELLEAGVNVTVYNGQLDLIVDTMGRIPLWGARGGSVIGGDKRELAWDMSVLGL